MSSTPSSPGSMNIQEALSKAYAHWNAGQADQAEMLAQRVLAAWPGQPDALHLLGLMAHAYGNLDLAISHLRQACLAPRAPAVYSSNLAEMCRQKGLLAEGVEAAQRAVNMDPALVSGWNNLGILQQETGRFEESRQCLERVIALNPGWPEAHNNLGNTWRRLGRMDRAEACYRQALALNPSYPEAHSNLAYLLSSKGNFDDAAKHAREAIDLNPQLVDAYLNLAEVEISRQRADAALRALDMLNAFAPRHPAALVARAKALKHLDHNEEALEFARAAIALTPDNADAHQTVAQSLQDLGRTEDALRHYAQAAALPGISAETAMAGSALLLTEAGRRDEALAAFDAALERFPGSAVIMAARSDLRTYSANDPDIAAMEAWLVDGDDRPLPDRIGVHFALGKAYLDVGDSARAFAHFEAGSRQKRSTFDHDSAKTAATMQAICATITPERFARLSGLGEPSSMPVFIIGMPRSGTTLIEQIISSHPLVTGAGELSALRHAVDRMGEFPDWLVKLDDASASAALKRCGEDYLSRVKPLAQGRPHVVDKMPGNFVHAGLIPLVLPGARIIHARRDPVDTCLSCYTKLFGGLQPFSYDLTELGLFYREYERMMAHWRSVLPAERFLEVEYEAVVDDLEGEARRMIEFLGLQWDDACLSFHTNQRIVRTASVNQVRKPIYRTSKGRWQKHAAYLKPLLDVLEIEAP
ncbi:tetratricopeptide repeat protein [Paraburkholderia tropica]|uniref:tetratricopeptide repeat-containing sulfotransferase family protein n=1 Tax=Paraburkholderia tropica TaxID=92647 RepID=UPI0015FF9284|nr:tetratricopeptide repeat-containing sulfotransferase family protein [Paraburkholderia tropica]QNB16913.1 tetratricopeptide repeat protein [Paraburkholderia tropica]